MVVMWALVLLSSIAGAVVTVHRTETALSTNLQDTLQGQAIGEAGVYYAIAKLTQDVPRIEGEEPWGFDATPHAWSFAGKELRITVAGESGRIDLNAAPPELLLQLLEVAGVSAPEAEALVDAIQDWRDVDSDTHINGAEDPEYEQAGRPYGAKDATFSSVQELRQVLGMTSQLYDILAPALTIYSGRSKVNPYFASRLALMAALAGDEEETDRYLESRAELQPGGAPLPFPGGGASAYLQQVRDAVYRITVATPGSEGGQFAVEAIVRITGRDYQILGWEPVGLAGSG